MFFGSANFSNCKQVHTLLEGCSATLGLAVVTAPDRWCWRRRIRFVLNWLTAIEVFSFNAAVLCSRSILFGPTNRKFGRYQPSGLHKGKSQETHEMAFGFEGLLAFLHLNATRVFFQWMVCRFAVVIRSLAWMDCTNASRHWFISKVLAQVVSRIFLSFLTSGVEMYWKGYSIVKTRLWPALKCRPAVSALWAGLSQFTVNRATLEQQRRFSTCDCSSRNVAIVCFRCSTSFVVQSKRNTFLVSCNKG